MAGGGQWVSTESFWLSGRAQAGSNAGMGYLLGWNLKMLSRDVTGIMPLLIA
jgi:hypothetical protein